MPDTPITREQTDALSKLTEIPPAGSEERERWLQTARLSGFVPPDEYFTHWGAAESTILTLMSEARKQGQRDVLGAGDLDDAAVDRALDAFFGHLPHPDKPWGGSWRQQMRDALRAARGPMDQQSAEFIADCDRVELIARLRSANAFKKAGIADELMSQAADMLERDARTALAMGGAR